MGATFFKLAGWSSKAVTLAEVVYNGLKMKQLSLQEYNRVSRELRAD